MYVIAMVAVSWPMHKNLTESEGVGLHRRLNPGLQ